MRKPRFSADFGGFAVHPFPSFTVRSTIDSRWPTIGLVRQALNFPCSRGFRHFFAWARDMSKGVLMVITDARSPVKRNLELQSSIPRSWSIQTRPAKGLPAIVDGFHDFRGHSQVVLADRLLV